MRIQIKHEKAVLTDILELEKLELSSEQEYLLERAADVAKTMLDPSSRAHDANRQIVEKLRSGERGLLKIAEASEQITHLDMAVRINARD